MVVDKIKDKKPKYKKVKVVKGFCGNCGKRQIIQHASHKKLPNFNFAHTGICIVCKGKVFRKIKFKIEIKKTKVGKKEKTKYTKKEVDNYEQILLRV